MSNNYNNYHPQRPVTSQTRDRRQYDAHTAPTEPSDLALSPSPFSPSNLGGLTPSPFAPLDLLLQPVNENLSQHDPTSEYGFAGPQNAEEEPQMQFYLPQCKEYTSDPEDHTEDMTHCENIATHPTPHEVCTGCHEDTTLEMSAYVAEAQKVMQLAVCAECAQRLLFEHVSTGRPMRGCQCEEAVDQEWCCRTCRFDKWKARVEKHHFRVLTLTMNDGTVKCPCDERLPNPESLVTICSQCREVTAVERKQ